MFISKERIVPVSAAVRAPQLALPHFKERAQEKQAAGARGCDHTRLVFPSVK